MKTTTLLSVMSEKESVIVQPIDDSRRFEGSRLSVSKLLHENSLENSLVAGLRTVKKALFKRKTIIIVYEG